MTINAPRPPPLPAFRLARTFGRVHWIGIWTVFRRDMIMFRKFWPISLAGPFLNVMMYLMILSLALGPDRNTPAGAQVIPFIAPGLILFAVLTRAAESSAFTLMLRKMEGDIGELLSPPLLPGEALAGIALASLTTGLIGGVPVAAGVLLTTDVPVTNPFLALLVALLTSMLTGFFGIWIGLWSQRWDHMAAIFGFVLIPVAFLSGVFTRVGEMPEPLNLIVWASPIAYAVDAFRAAFTGENAIPVWISLTVLAGSTMALALFCRHLFAIGYRLKA